MIVNKASLSALFVSMSAIFNGAFAAAPAQWEKIAMRAPSTTGQNDYAWLANFPKMRPWIGDKYIKNLEGFKYSVANRSFEATIAVKRDDMDDDALGMVPAQTQQAGYSAKQWPDEMVFDVVNAGFSSLCFDGQYFFDTDHGVGEASVSNKGVAPLSAASLALAQASYGAARTAMRKFKDDEGRPLNVIPDTLLVPPALEDIANALMTVDRLEDGKPNPYKGTAKVVVDNHLTSDTAWFLLDTSKPVKPFIFQERKAPVFVSQTNPDSDDVFTKGEFKFGVEARGAAGYGFWQLAYGSTGLG